MPASVPPAVRRGGAVVALEGAAALVVAIVLVVLGIEGADGREAYGTAGWFVIVGGAVLAAGVALLRGRRWGRGLAVFVQLLLLPVAWYMAIGSHRPELGIPVAVVAVVALVFLFSPATLQWATGMGDGDGQGSASADSSAPDTR